MTARTAQAARAAAMIADGAREHMRYGDRDRPTRTFDGFDPETPVAGFYAMPLRQGGVMVGIHIWHGPPRDPHSGELMDRHWRWQATANREHIDLERVWPVCARRLVDQAEHDHLCRLQQWGRENDPDGALADPRQRIDPLTAPTPF